MVGKHTEMNHYKTLNVSRSASQAEIRQAYLRAIAEAHPDRDPSESAIARARDVNLAYEILGDTD
jgi:molecular chaperone DnaJ